MQSSFGFELQHTRSPAVVTAEPRRWQWCEWRTHTHTHTHVHHVETYGCRSKGLSLVVHAVISTLAILSYEYIQAFAWTCRKRRHFLSFFLCLSRACLGKMIGFSIEWLKSGVFRTLMVHRL